MKGPTIAAVTPILALAMLAGCKPTTHDEQEGSDAKAVTGQLRQAEEQWNRDYAARDAAGIASHYAGDAALANPGAPLVTGGRDIQKAVTEFAADQNLKVSFASDRVQVARSGDIAYTRGHFSMESTDPTTGRVRQDSGNYLTVWQKQADGQWKAVEDFVVPGAAQPSTAGN